MQTITSSLNIYHNTDIFIPVIHNVETQILKQVQDLTRAQGSFILPYEMPITSLTQQKLSMERYKKIRAIPTGIQMALYTPGTTMGITQNTQKTYWYALEINQYKQFSQVWQILFVNYQQTVHQPHLTLGIHTSAQNNVLLSNTHDSFVPMYTLFGNPGDLSTCCMYAKESPSDIIYTIRPPPSVSIEKKNDIPAFIQKNSGAQSFQYVPYNTSQYPITTITADDILLVPVVNAAIKSCVCPTPSYKCPYIINKNNPIYHMPSIKIPLNMNHILPVFIMKSRAVFTKSELDTFLLFANDYEKNTIVYFDTVYMATFEQSQLYNSLFRQIPICSNIDWIENCENHTQTQTQTIFERYSNINTDICLKVQCIYHTRFQKWIPYKNVTDDPFVNITCISQVI